MTGRRDEFLSILILDNVITHGGISCYGLEATFSKNPFAYFLFDNFVE